MGGKIGHNDAQTFEEIKASEIEKKEKVMTKQGRRIYKAESMEIQTDAVQRFVGFKTEELKEGATKERVSLGDTEEVKKRTFIYLKACEESGTFPSSLGLARSIGYSDRALRNWRNKHPDTPTTQWLEIYNELCADILGQAALTNNANSIYAMFLSKALYDFREVSEFVITPNTSDMEERTVNIEDIRRRYMLENKDKEGRE